MWGRLLVSVIGAALVISTALAPADAESGVIHDGTNDLKAGWDVKNARPYHARNGNVRTVLYFEDLRQGSDWDIIRIRINLRGTDRSPEFSFGVMQNYDRMRGYRMSSWNDHEDGFTCDNGFYRQNNSYDTIEIYIPAVCLDYQSNHSGRQMAFNMFVSGNRPHHALTSYDRLPDGNGAHTWSKWFSAG